MTPMTIMALKSHDDDDDDDDHDDDPEVVDDGDNMDDLQADVDDALAMMLMISHCAPSLADPYSHTFPGSSPPRRRAVAA